jgi:hypothetical protein
MQLIQSDEMLSSVGKTKKAPRKRRKDDIPTPSTSDAESFVDEDGQDASMTSAPTLWKSKGSDKVNRAEAEQSELDCA